MEFAPEKEALFLTQFILELAAISGIVLFVAKQLVQLASRSIELNFKHSKDVELERHRSDLRVAAHALETRNSALVERQSEVIAKIYKNLVTAQRTTSKVMTFGTVFETDDSVLERQRQDAVQATAIFIDHFEEHLIYLDEATSARVAGIAQQFRRAWIGHELHCIVVPGKEPNTKGLEETWAIIQRDVPAAKLALQQDFRNALGVTSLPTVKASADT